MIDNAIMGAIATGTYTGDGTANRSIPHGLGKVPTLILIISTTVMAIVISDGATGKTVGTAAANTTTHTQTAATNVNFYVGKPATVGFWSNDNANEFIWYAWK